MELVLPVHAAGDLPGTDGVDDGRDAHQKGVFLFFQLQENQT
jgi:hypothetical protein